jgi:hypothetical protein
MDPIIGSREKMIQALEARKQDLLLRKKNGEKPWRARTCREDAKRGRRPSEKIQSTNNSAQKNKQGR